MEKRYQVFVSATFEDLIVERETISMAVLRSHNIPSGMELSSGANERTLDIIYSWIDDSDFVLLLLGGRYGSQDRVTYERENIDKWHRFKQRVTGDGFCIPISDPAELEPKVFAALDAVKTSHGPGGWVRVSSVLEDMLDQYATYTNTYLEILASNLYTQREIEDLLRTVQGVLGKS